MLNGDDTRRTGVAPEDDAGDNGRGPAGPGRNGDAASPPGGRPGTTDPSGSQRRSRLPPAVTHRQGNIALRPGQRRQRPRLPVLLAAVAGLLLAVILYAVFAG